MYILLGIVVAIAAVVAYASTKPNTSRYVRSTSIQGPARAVYANVIDLHKWEAWSPWVKIDPNMKVTYEGAASGPGQKYTWDSKNNKAGAGAMTIAAAAEPSTVTVDLQFFRPMKGEAKAIFTFNETNGITQATWTLETKNTLGSKLFGLFVNMDKMLGKDFEAGLAGLKKVVEGGA